MVLFISDLWRQAQEKGYHSTGAPSWTATCSLVLSCCAGFPSGRLARQVLSPFAGLPPAPSARAAASHIQVLTSQLPFAPEYFIVVCVIVRELVLSAFLSGGSV